MKLDYYQLVTGGATASVAYMTAGRFGYDRTAVAIVVLTRTFFLVLGSSIGTAIGNHFFPDTKQQKARKFLISAFNVASFFLSGKVGEVATRKLGVPLSYVETVGLSSLYMNTAIPFYWLISKGEN